MASKYVNGGTSCGDQVMGIIFLKRTIESPHKCLESDAIGRTRLKQRGSGPTVSQNVLLGAPYERGSRQAQTLPNLCAPDMRFVYTESFQSVLAARLLT